MVCIMLENQTTAADRSELRSVETVLNYAGEIDGTPRFDIEATRTRIAFDPHTVTICDARPVCDRFSLDREGFALVEHESPIAVSPEMRALNSTHEMEGNPVNDAYHRQLAEFLRKLTGAREVIGQRSGLLVRTSTAARNRTWAGPAGFVHLDYVPETARMFREISIAGEGIAIAPYRRFAVYQTWRAISQPPQDNTLAICDGRSVPPEDAVVFDAVVGPPGKPGSEFQARMCKYRPDHKWYYFSNMHPAELLVFKGYDSEIPYAMNAMHTAFEDPSAGAAAIPRESIEARFFAFFE
jgi:hypothetical protein